MSDSFFTDAQITSKKLPSPIVSDTEYDIMVVREGFFDHNVLIFSKKESICLQLGTYISDSLNINAIQRYSVQDIKKRDVVVTSYKHYNKRSIFEDEFYVPTIYTQHFIRFGIPEHCVHPITPYKSIKTRMCSLLPHYKKMGMYTQINIEVPKILMTVEKIPEVSDRMIHNAHDIPFFILEMNYDPDLLIAHALNTATIKQITSTRLSNTMAVNFIRELKQNQSDRRRTILDENVGPYNSIDSIKEIIKPVKDYNTTFLFRGLEL